MVLRRPGRAHIWGVPSTGRPGSRIGRLIDGPIHKRTRTRPSFGLTAAHRGKDRYLVAVRQRRRSTLGRLVAIDPHPRSREHALELVAEANPCLVEQVSESRGHERLLGDLSCFACLREEPQSNARMLAQVDTSASPFLITVSPSGFVVSNP